MNTAHQLAVQYCSTLSDETATKAIGDSFVAGFEAAVPGYRPVSAGPPKRDTSETNNILCLVWLYDNSIELLSFNQAYGCWDDKYADDYHCDFDQCKGYWPIPESLLNFKP